MNASTAHVDTLLRQAGSLLGIGKRRVRRAESWSCPARGWAGELTRLGPDGCNQSTSCREDGCYFTRPTPGTPRRAISPCPRVSARKTLPPHQLGGVRRRDATYSSRRGARNASARVRDDQS
jgi:hypothetical protein